MAGLAHYKTQSQRRHDHERVTYRLTFPAHLEPEQTQAWLHAISGTLQMGAFKFNGSPTLAFETWATDRGFTHRLKVRWQDAPYVIGQLRTKIPGIHYEQETDLPHYQWTSVTELGESDPARSLRIVSAEDMSSSLLGSMQALEPGEAILYQWVVMPARPERPPKQERFTRTSHFGLGLLLGMTAADKDEVADRRVKLAEPNMLGVLRIATRAETAPRAAHLLGRVRKALAAARSPENRFKRTLATDNGIRRRINEAAGLLTYPAKLSLSELTALLGWPVGSPHVAGLPAGRTRHLPATELIPREGEGFRTIFVSNFPGAERKLAISHRNACRHVYILGPTGSGKTVAAGEHAVDDMRQGKGVVVMDPKGDLFDYVLDRVPRGRLEDVIVLDINDTAWPVGFNIMGQGKPSVAIDNIKRLFEHLYPDLKRGVWGRLMFHYGLHTLSIDPTLTFADLPALLSPKLRDERDEAWRKELLGKLQDPDLVKHWQNYDKLRPMEQAQQTDPVVDRAWQLIGRPAIRHIIGQSKSTFDMRDVLANQKILLVNLHGEGGEEAGILGALLMASLWSAAKTGVASEDKPTFLYLDEFQDVMRFPATDVEEILAKSRKYGLGATLMHQFTGQLQLDMRQAVSANTLTQMVFQTASADDTRHVARQFGSLVSEEDISNLGRFEVIGRLATDAGMSSPVTGTTMPPSRPTGFAHVVRDMSRAKYGRPVADVVAEIANRRTPTNTRAKRKPKLGETEWA